MANGTDPGRMTEAERLDEVAAVLSLAMMRVWLKRRRACGGQRAVSRDSPPAGEDCLELAAASSPDGPSTFERSNA